MTSKELKLKLIEALPEIKDVYNEETSWQEGDETGSHVVYEDVFVPFIKEQIEIKNKNSLTKIFEFLEELIKSGNDYAIEVVTLSVLESLLFDEDTDTKFFLQFAKEKTLKIIQEIVQDLET